MDKLDNLELLMQSLTNARYALENVEYCWEENVLTEKLEDEVLELIEQLQYLESKFESRYEDLCEDTTIQDMDETVDDSLEN